MHQSAAASAKKQAEVDHLQLLFDRLASQEPQLLASALEAIEHHLVQVMPRARAYIIETGAKHVEVGLSITLDFDEKKPGVSLLTKITPPTYEKATHRHTNELGKPFA